MGNTDALMRSRKPPVHRNGLWLQFHRNISTMNVDRFLKKSCWLCFAAVLGTANILQDASAKDQNLAIEDSKQLIPFEQRSKISYDAYILGPGDGLQIELLDLPELSGTFSIGPDGTLYLPRLRALYVEGLTIEELRVFLTKEFSAYVRDPKVYVRPVNYRPVRVYVGGEVRRPGYYTLSGNNLRSRISDSAEKLKLREGTTNERSLSSIRQLPGGANEIPTENSLTTFGAVFPTVFDAIRTAQGITPYSDLTQVKVIRKRAQNLGGGRISTNLNFLSLITDGNESQNIRLFDGDVLEINKSPVILREQLLKAGQSNLNPQFMQVFITGRVENPGSVTLPQGSSLNQAINLAGGAKLIKGKIEFIRFNIEGTIDRRIFSYRPSAQADTSNNPILNSGDVIRIKNSLLSASLEVLNEITTPAVGIYSAYSLLNGFTK